MAEVTPPKDNKPKHPLAHALWRKLTFPFLMLYALFKMVAHPEHYSFDDDDE